MKPFTVTALVTKAINIGVIGAEDHESAICAAYDVIYSDEVDAATADSIEHMIAIEEDFVEVSDSTESRLKDEIERLKAQIKDLKGEL